MTAQNSEPNARQITASGDAPEGAGSSALRCACGEQWGEGRCKHPATQEDRLCDDCRKSKTCTESRARLREKATP